jgi:ABC-2 type transport system ATP-binding protein
MKYNKNNDIEIIKLNKTYFDDKKNKVTALKNISLKVKKGSMLALLGPNGAGKSTLINILAGIVNKTSGDVFINGNNYELEERAAKQSIGVVPQELVIDPYFTPKETLEFQAGYYGINKSNRITMQLLRNLKLEDKASAYVRHLSGGMKRRLMIAKAMVHSPQVLILDEPTAGVDVSLRELLWQNIKDLNNKGVTILITTHYLEEAEALCQDVAIINKGEIVINGNIKKLVKKIDKKILKVYSENLKTLPSGLKNIGFKKYNNNEISIDYKPSQHSIDQLINEVVKYNIKVKDISIKDTTLEDLFKEITR